MERLGRRLGIRDAVLRPSEVRLLEEDPDLARDLAEDERRLAAAAVTARERRADVGRWQPPAAPARDPSHFGVLVLAGFLERQVELYGIGCVEVLGTGDLVYPWEQEEGEPSIPMAVVWTVLAPLRFAEIDAAVLAAAARWPPVVAALHRRQVRITQSLAVHFAITCLVGLELRLYVLFWHLADRFGHVQRDGVVLPLPLTHEVLGRLVRARRPSVSTAMKALAERELLVRQDDGSWLIRGDLSQELARLRGPGDVRDAGT